MSVTCTVNASRVMTMLAKLEKLGSDGKHIAAEEGAKCVRTHFRKLATRRHRGGGHDWYGMAAENTQGRVDGRDVVISINHEGIGLRRFGGTVRPGAGKKYLTLPEADEAHGKTAWDFKNLHFRQNRSGDSGRLCDPQGRVFYWLVKKTVHKPDPTVLPTDADFVGAILPELTAELERT